jgi:hypothetical protein
MVGQTLKSTNEAYYHCLPLNNILCIYSDTIQLTRLLGYKYIWIDTFCIIQDNKANKTCELPKIGEIYYYVLFIIYTKGSLDS